MKTLTDDDIEAVALSLLRAMSRRLQTEEKPAAIMPPEAPPALEKSPPPKLAYTLKELSAELGISRISLYRLISRGLIKPLPYLRTKIFARAEVERFLAEGMYWSGAVDGARKKREAPRGRGGRLGKS